MADSMVTVFTREENVRDFLESQDVGLVERVVNAVKRLVKEIKAAVQRIAKRNPETAAMLKQDADTLQEIADRFDRLGAMANAVRESEGNADNRGGNDRLSIRDRNGNEMPVGEDAYEENKRIIANMEPIVTLKGNPFEKNEREDFRTMGTKYFNSIGNVAHSPVFGDIRLDVHGIDHLISQKLTRRKTALLPAVKDVIEKGRVIMTDENHKENRFDTAIVAGVGEWNGKPFYMGVVLRQDEGYKNSYYFHDAVIEEKRRPTISQQVAGGGVNASIVREGDGQPSVSSILANLADYNTEFQEKFSLRDDAYMSAAQSGDTQTAQRMLDEEAEEKFARSKVRDKKGRLLKVYHGTNAQFTVFDTSKQGGVNGTAEGYGIYLSDSQEVTEHYGERQIAAYVNITHPATRWKKTITQARLAKLIKETCMRQARRMVDDGDYRMVREAVKDSWVSNYTDTYGTTMDAAYRDVAAQIIEANDSDMDIIQEVMSGMSIRSYAAAEEFYNEVLTPVTGIDGFWTTWKNRETEERHNIILAFNSEQIKSAEPVTYDDAGEIIPLGERFSKENPDIRYSLRDVDTQDDEKQISQKKSEKNSIKSKNMSKEVFSMHDKSEKKNRENQDKLIHQDEAFRLTMTVDEAAKELNISRTTAYHLVKQKEFPAFNISR